MAKIYHALKNVFFVLKFIGVGVARALCATPVTQALGRAPLRK